MPTISLRLILRPSTRSPASGTTMLRSPQMRRNDRDAAVPKTLIDRHHPDRICNPGRHAHPNLSSRRKGTLGKRVVLQHEGDGDRLRNGDGTECTQSTRDAAAEEIARSVRDRAEDGRPCRSMLEDHCAPPTPRAIARCRQQGALTFSQSAIHGSSSDRENATSRGNSSMAVGRHRLIPEKSHVTSRRGIAISMISHKHIERPSD